ncbi:MAG: lytic murein transglycosylase [Nitratireductor sp.]|nr:lytic murein transglycosylase [Nitratireductor sp.]
MTFLRRSLVLLVALITIGAQPVLALDRAAIERQFQAWLKAEIWPKAAAQGVSAGTFNAAFAGVTLNWKLPGLVPPGEKLPREQHQAEFRSPAGYFSEKTLGAVIAGGQTRLTQYGALLGRIERETGVPGQIALAVWGRESGFGRAKIPYNAFEVLGTKAFMSTRRGLFEAELVAALVMVERGHVDVAAMKGSWAGALGQPQFLPSSYLAHAADGDGDNFADIWKSDADTLASIANFLRNKGWVAGRDWGFEVAVPEAVSCALEGPDRGRPIGEWAKLGVERVSGRPFPAHELGAEGYLLMPAGRFGPAFVVTPNFYVLKEYNTSDLYALFIGHAGDRIRYGGRPFAGAWGKVDSLYRSDIAAMQRKLEQKGYDVGGADGLPGYKTRRSIGEWQASTGARPACFPTAEILRTLK